MAGLYLWFQAPRGNTTKCRIGQFELVGDTPVRELLLADGLDPVSVVERVPQLGDDEELLALDEAVFYGASNALSALLLIAVVWRADLAVSE